MRYIAVSEEDLLWDLMASPDLEEDEVVFVSGDANLKKRVARRGADAISGDIYSPRVYERADVREDAMVVLLLQDESRIRSAAEAIRQVSQKVPLVALSTGSDQLDRESLRKDIPDLEVIHLQEAFHDRLRTELKHAATRELVSQYKQDFAQAEKVLILVHDEPDPDSIGSALALRNVLGRDRRTAIIGTPGNFTRPENVKMAQLLDIQIQKIEKSDINAFQRIGMVDCQPNVMADLVDAVDLVIDHHPIRKGYQTRFQDIRPGCGATATIMVEHMQAAGLPISERLATALLYAIKTDTLFLERGTTRADVEAFSQMYRLADPAAVRRIEGAGLSMDHMKVLAKALRRIKLQKGLCYVHLGRVDREDYIPYLADFFLDLQEVEWAAVSGVFSGNVVMSMRNLGYQKSAGKLAKELFDTLGNAGGHRAAAKAVLPLKVVREKAGSARGSDISAWLWKILSEARGD